MTKVIADGPRDPSSATPAETLIMKSRKRKKKTRKKRSENDDGNQMKKKHLRKDVIL